jgi:predicted nucleic acid-binding protein
LEDWPSFVKLNVSQSVLNTAGTFAGNFGLRAYDSVQLATSVALAASVEGVGFSSFDLRLNRAAQALGLPLGPSAS